MSCNLKSSILKFDRPVPRYTSYPTAPHFKPLDRSRSYVDWLSSLKRNARLSLYLHVPFCPKMCWYCGCHTKITQRYAPVEDYVHLVMREIAILKTHIPKECTVDHIHFGGGSPGMLRAVDFTKLMETLRRNFNIDKKAEIAIEIDPRGVTEGRVAAYAAAGVNRISLGVQDFDEQVLQSVNRPQPFHLSYDAVLLFRLYGINAINVDIMYGLPHQTVKTVRKTMENLLLLDPDRISFFGYAHVPWMKKHMTLIDQNALPDKDNRYDLFEVGASVLVDAGYAAIGIDHFAKSTDELTRSSRQGLMKRNFQGYTTDNSDTLLGIGVSAISKFSQGYIQNSPDRPIYERMVMAGELPVTKICTLSTEDNLRAAVIERLMCNFEVDLPNICMELGFPPDHLNSCLQDLKIYETENFYGIENGILRVNKNARQTVRLICAVFDAYFSSIPDKPRHAHAI